MSQIIESIKNGTALEIKNGVELENFRDELSRNNLETLMGYDDTYGPGEGVSSGFMHYSKNGDYFFLSKKEKLEEIELS